MGRCSSMESGLLGCYRHVVAGDFYSLLRSRPSSSYDEWSPCWSLVSLDIALVSRCGGCARFELSLYLACAGRRARRFTYGPRPADSERYCHVLGGTRDSRATYSNCVFDRCRLSRSHCGGRNCNSGDHRTNRVATCAITRGAMRWRELVHPVYLRCGCDRSRWDRGFNCAHK